METSIAGFLGAIRNVFGIPRHHHRVGRAAIHSWRFRQLQPFNVGGDSLLADLYGCV